MFRRERRMSNDTSLLDEARDCAARNPKRAFELESRHVAAYPEDSTGYFHRHFSWIRLGAYDKAMQDCETAIRPNAKPVMFMARGDLYRLLGDHARAVEDFTRARDLNYEDWLTSFGPHHRAGSLARLGRLEDALADCALIADDHRMPAHRGLPGGSKTEFIAEIRRLAARPL